MSQPWDTGIDEYEQAELRADLSAALLCLTEKQRLAVYLVCYLGYTQEEAAAMMGMAQESVRDRLAGAIPKIQQKLAA